MKLCVLFDMDGTLYDSGIDFLAIREKLELPQKGMPILDQLRDAPLEVQIRGTKLLLSAEAKGAGTGQLIPGAAELLSWLQDVGIRCGLITNNSRRSVDTILAKHPLSFDLILTRDDGAAKPHPHLFLKALQCLHIQPEHAVAVGDTHLDALAAHQAGIREIHLVCLPEWMAALIPEEILYKASANLNDVRTRIGEWIDNMPAL
ncbi:HAD family hydrolase [Candidatus Bipolaricaulota bacterium]